MFAAFARATGAEAGRFYVRVINEDRSQFKTHVISKLARVTSR